MRSFNVLSDGVWGIDACDEANASDAVPTATTRVSASIRERETELYMSIFLLGAT
jgi:hypothetical protein